MKYEIKIEITAKRLADLMTDVIEGQGCGAWLGLCSARWGSPKPRKTAHEPWYSVPAFFERDDNKIHVYDMAADDAAEQGVLHVIGPEHFIHGLRIMAAKHPRAFAEILNEEDDGNTKDIFFQCVVFGEVLYA